MGDPIFSVCSVLILLGAILVVSRRNPIYSAVWLVLTLLSVAVLLLHLNAPFVALIHVLVYTGAITILFVFTIMLLNLRREELGKEFRPLYHLLIIVFCGFFTLAIIKILDASAWIRLPFSPAPEKFGSPDKVGIEIFTKFIVPFEIVSILIVVAIVGAIVLAKKRP